MKEPCATRGKICSNFLRIDDFGVYLRNELFDMRIRLKCNEVCI